MVFELIHTVEESAGTALLLSPGLRLKIHGKPDAGILYQGRDYVIYFTDTPVYRRVSGEYAEVTDLAKILAPDFLEGLENEVSGIIASTQEGNFRLKIFSCRASRSRMYFIRKANAFYFSTGLRELLPFQKEKSIRKLLTGLLNMEKRLSFILLYRISFPSRFLMCWR